MKKEIKIKFYTMNLSNGYLVEQKAIKNLLERYDIKTINNITNADEIGIVEYVANNQFYIANNKILIEE